MQYIANYTKERQILEDILEPFNSKKIVVIKGQSGIGKSTLLDYYLEKYRNITTRVDCRYGNIDINHILLKIEQFYQEENLKNFINTWEKFEQNENHLNLAVNGNSLSGNENQMHINLVLQQQQDKEKSNFLRAMGLTRALFFDLQHIDKPLILIVDTFNNLNRETKIWLESVFLSYVINSKNLKVIIASQEWLEGVNGIEWGYSCERCELKGIQEAEHWLPVVEQLGMRLPSLEWLAGLCYGCRGNPKLILESLIGFSKEQAVL